MKKGSNSGAAMGDKRQESEDVQRMLDRVREMQETQERLMRELQESIDATGRLLESIEERRRAE